MKTSAPGEAFRRKRSCHGNVSTCRRTRVRRWRVMKLRRRRMTATRSASLRVWIRRTMLQMEIGSCHPSSGPYEAQIRGCIKVWTVHVQRGGGNYLDDMLQDTAFPKGHETAADCCPDCWCQCMLSTYWRLWMQVWLKPSSTQWVKLLAEQTLLTKLRRRGNRYLNPKSPFIFTSGVSLCRGPAYISSFSCFPLCFLSEPLKEAVANAETGTINRSIGMIQSHRRVSGF